ncbi:S26 family signal peptidase [Puia sp.]|jgi:signal peptidase I|uniref:S26 family signal peptidase n=1 Tax=Puia sp. TaxID=2045100 RepID=UPI002F40B5CB
MSAHHVFVLILVQLFLLLSPSIGVYKLFEKAGVPGWKAFVPLYNTWVMMTLAERPRHWVFWQLIPVVGWFMTMGIYVEYVKVYGKFHFYEHALASLFPLAYFPYLGWDAKTKYIGGAAARKHKKSKTREWIDAGVFAVVAATLIRTFVFEAYVIPTGSMEKTLLVNDYLFVSKFAYGPRIPMTPLSIPFVHNTLPLVNRKSYVEWIELPYVRWFESPVKREDVVVFNFPEGDTLINLPAYQSADPYYDVIRRLGNGNSDSGRQIVLGDPDQYPLILHPPDKEENYIKRCTAIAGDTIQLKDQVIYINGKAQPLPPESQTKCIVKTHGQPLDETVMQDEYNLDITDPSELSSTNNPNEYQVLLTAAARDKLLKNGVAVSITPLLDSTTPVWPYSPLVSWKVDNYGPLFIPKRGSTIQLNPTTYTLYQRAIRVYEGNKFEFHDGKYFLNDQEVHSYTFRYNYYWMMGDNRHESQDSRFWGVVPETMIVGEASLIWMSWGKGIRWNRLFSRIK